MTQGQLGKKPRGKGSRDIWGGGRKGRYLPGVRRRSEPHTQIKQKNQLIINIVDWVFNGVKVEYNHTCGTCEGGAVCFDMFLPDDQQETATKLKPNETVVECSRLSRGPISLRFRSYALEANFMKEVAIGRLPVLITIAAFDVFLLLLRIALKAFLGDKRAFPSRAKPLWHQSATLLALHTLIAVIHVRSKQSGAAASQVNFVNYTARSLVCPHLTCRWFFCFVGRSSHCWSNIQRFMHADSLSQRS